MPFRDRTMSCPRCGVDLVRYDERDKWRCKDCLGTLVGKVELRRELGRHAAGLFDLAPDIGETDYNCPVCNVRMTPISLGDEPAIELERCDTDKVVWFDPGELGDVRKLPDPDAGGRFEEAMRRLVELGEVRRR